MTDDEIAELRLRYERGTPPPWFLSYDRLKQAIVTDKDGRVIVESDSYAADVALIVEMHRAIPRLLEALTKAQEDLNVALVNHELEANKHRNETITALAKCASDVGDRDETNRRLADKAADLAIQLAHAKVRAARCEAMEPVVLAAQRYAKYRYLPALLSAVAGFDAWEKCDDRSD